MTAFGLVVAHVLDEGASLPDILTAETCGGDWMIWNIDKPRAGCRIENTVAIALGVCTCMSDVTVSGLNW